MVDGYLKCSHCELRTWGVGGRNFQKTDDRWVLPAQPSSSWRPQEEGSHSTGCVLRPQTHCSKDVAANPAGGTLDHSLSTACPEMSPQALGPQGRKDNPLWPTWPLTLAWGEAVPGGPFRELQLGALGSGPSSVHLDLGAVRGG